MSDYHFSHWEIESYHELGFKKGERYWIRGWGWMKLERVERTLLDSGVAVTYHFVGESHSRQGRRVEG